MSVLEIWGAEYQENNALLIKPSDREIFQAMADRKNCPHQFLWSCYWRWKCCHSRFKGWVLELVLGDMPQKTFIDDHIKMDLKPLMLPEGTTVMNVVARVRRLTTVGSKRFLVHKVDRSVTGLVAQQQCVGPLQLPLANCGVTAHTHFVITGTAVACGEQPIKGFVDSAEWQE